MGQTIAHSLGSPQDKEQSKIQKPFNYIFKRTTTEKMLKYKAITEKNVRRIMLGELITLDELNQAQQEFELMLQKEKQNIQIQSQKIQLRDWDHSLKDEMQKYQSLLENQKKQQQTMFQKLETQQKTYKKPKKEQKQKSQQPQRNDRLLSEITIDQNIFDHYQLQITEPDNNLDKIKSQTIIENNEEKTPHSDQTPSQSQQIRINEDRKQEKIRKLDSGQRSSRNQNRLVELAQDAAVKIATTDFENSLLRQQERIDTKRSYDEEFLDDDLRRDLKIREFSDQEGPEINQFSSQKQSGWKLASDQLQESSRLDQYVKEDNFDSYREDEEEQSQKKEELEKEEEQQIEKEESDSEEPDKKTEKTVKGWDSVSNVPPPKKTLKGSKKGPKPTPKAQETTSKPKPKQQDIKQTPTNNQTEKNTQKQIKSGQPSEQLQEEHFESQPQASQLSEQSENINENLEQISEQSNSKQDSNENSQILDRKTEQKKKPLLTTKKLGTGAANENPKPKQLQKKGSIFQEPTRSKPKPQNRPKKDSDDDESSEEPTKADVFIRQPTLQEEIGQRSTQKKQQIPQKSQKKILKRASQVNNELLSNSQRESVQITDGQFKNKMALMKQFNTKEELKRLREQKMSLAELRQFIENIIGQMGEKMDGETKTNVNLCNRIKLIFRQEKSGGVVKKKS